MKTCPHCQHISEPTLMLKPLPSTKKTLACEACRGEWPE